MRASYHLTALLLVAATDVLRGELLIEWMPPRISPYRTLKSDGPLTVVLAFFNAKTEPLMSIGCQDEFGLPDKVVQQVGLWKLEHPGFVEIAKANITNLSPWYNTTTLNTGYRYASLNITLEFESEYAIGCMTGLPGYTPYYEYSNIITTSTNYKLLSWVQYGESLNFGASSTIKTTDQSTIAFLTADAWYGDGVRLLDILSVDRNRTKPVTGDYSMRGVQFLANARLTLTAIGVEFIRPGGIEVGIWKKLTLGGSTAPIFRGVIPNTTEVKDGYVYLNMDVPLNLSAGTSYIVAAHVPYYYNHTYLEVKSSPLWSSLVSVFDEGDFGYPRLTTSAMYSVVKIEILPGAEIPIPPASTPTPPSTSPYRTPQAPPSPTPLIFDPGFPLWILGVVIPVIFLCCVGFTGVGIWISCKRRYNAKKEFRRGVVETVPVAANPEYAATTVDSRSFITRSMTEISKDESDTILTTSGEEFDMSQKKLGEGGFGVVRMGFDSNGLMVAIKAVPKGTSTEEIAILQGFVHPNIITLRGIAHSQVYTYIIMECATGGSLSNMIAAFGKLRVSDAKRFTRDILQGLVALHDKGIVHRDIKPGNVLYMADGVAKLADFGIVSATDKTMTSDKGTLRYMAPEAIKGERLTTQVDIWAVGLTLIEMVSGCRPWHKIKEDFSVVAHLFDSQEGASYVYPEGIEDDIRTFLLRLLCFDPKARATAHELLNSSFLNSG